MSAYTDHPTDAFEPVELPGIKYRLTKPLIWHVGKKASNLTVIVTPGFVFDVSIPTYWRWLFDPHDHRYLKAAALHDWLLDKGWSRITAAAIFHNALRSDGVTAWRRIVMWLAVSLFRYH